MTDEFAHLDTLGAHSVLWARRSPAVEHVEIDGETVAYDCERNAIHLLNPVATLLWQCLDGSSALGEISADLAAAFERAETEVLTDVLGFARELLAAQLAVTTS